MQEIHQLKIIGIDERRPPRVRKAPYIDLFYKLSQPAPEPWCADFNRLAKGIEPPVKVENREGNMLATYVRQMEDIPAHLEQIKQKVRECTEGYIEALRQQALAEEEQLKAQAGQGSEQGRLNQIIASLNFD